MTTTEKFVVMLAAALVAVGAPEKSEAQSIEGEELSAKEAYQQGAGFYEDGDYERAAKYFRYAVDKKSHPVLHFNLAQAYLELGELERALEQAAIAEELGGLEGSAAAANRSTLAAGHVIEQARAWEPPPTEPSEDTGIPDPEEMVDDESSVELTPLGWGGIGGAGLGVGLMIGAGVVDAGLSEDFQARRQARAEGDAGRVGHLTAQIQSKQTTGKVLLFSGAGLTAVGAGVVIYDLVRAPEADESAGLRLHLAPHPRSPGASFRIVF